MLADFMIWPWLERFDFLYQYRNFVLDKSKLDKLDSYIERMKNVPACNRLMNSAENHQKFYDGMLNESSTLGEYDHGLKD